MKQLYSFIAIALITFSGFSQGYEFAIVHNQNSNFSVVAIPDYNVTNSDMSDVGFTLMVPEGDSMITNMTLFYGRPWTATHVTAQMFSELVFIDSGGRDAFAMNLPPGQTIISHSAGNPIVLITFDVSNPPATGLLEILLNTDSIAIDLDGALDCFFNSNINGTYTQDYFSGIASGMGSYDFATLGVQEPQLSNVQFSIYPNPASNVINIKTDLEFTKVELYDILGKRVLETGATNQLNISSFKSGVYFVKLHSTKGTLTKKVVIE